MHSPKFTTALILSVVLHGAGMAVVWPRPAAYAPRLTKSDHPVRFVKLTKPAAPRLVAPLPMPPASRPRPAPRPARRVMRRPRATPKPRTIGLAPARPEPPPKLEPPQPPEPPNAEEELARLLEEIQIPEMSEQWEELIPEAPTFAPDAAKRGVVAVYVGGEVTQDHVRQYIAAQFSEMGLARVADPARWDGTEEAKVGVVQGFLSQMILNRMAAARAEELGLGDPAAMQNVLSDRAEQERIVELVRQLDRRRIEASDEEIAAYYAQHREEFGDVALESVRDRVAARVRGAKAEARFEEYMAELRSAHDLTTNFAAASAPNADADTALFTIDGTPYTVGEFRAFLAELSPRAQERYQDPAAREKLLDDILLRRLLLAEAPEASPQVQARVDLLRESILASQLRKRLVDDTITVEEEEVRQHYRQVRRTFRSPARARISLVRLPAGQTQEALLKAAERLREIRQEIVEAEDWVAAAQRALKPGEGGEAESIEEWVVQGSHDLFDPIQPCSICRAVFGLPEGGISQPLRWPGGRVAIIKVDELQHRRIPSYEELRPMVESDLWSAKRDAANQRLNRELLQSAQLRVREEGLREMVAPPVATAGAEPRPAGPEHGE